LNISILVRLFTRAISEATSELEHEDAQTSAMLDHALKPFIDKLKSMRAACMHQNQVLDGDEIIERLAQSLSSLDEHMSARLTNIATVEERQILDYLNRAGSKLQTEGSRMTSNFNLLKTVNGIVSEHAVPVDLQAAAASPDTVSVPASIRKSLDDRIKELSGKLEDDKTKKVKDWGYAVAPEAADAGSTDYDQQRLRVKTDKAIELLQMIRAYLDKDNVPYREIKVMITQVFSYDNLTRLSIPDDVVRFIHAGVAFHTWYANKQEYKPVKSRD
jgi:hypothetical protein